MNPEEIAALALKRVIWEILAKAAREEKLILIDPQVEREFMMEVVRSRLRAEGIDPDTTIIRVEQKDKGNWDAFITYPITCFEYEITVSGELAKEP